MKVLWIVIGISFSLAQRVFVYFWRNYQCASFASCGSNVWIGRNCTFTYKTISVGCDVYIGNGACFQSAHGKIEIGDHVMFGPGVHIHGGNHIINAVGVYMKGAAHKAVGIDGTVRICNDVWVGANAMILKGVTIGEGSVIGAGAIITHDVAPYTVVVGSLPRRVWERFDEDTLAVHCALLAEHKNS